MKFYVDDTICATLQRALLAQATYHCNLFHLRSNVLKSKGLAALSPGAPLTPFDFNRRDLGAQDVAVEIAYAGICHSDIHQVREEWGSAIFYSISTTQTGLRGVSFGDSLIKRVVETLRSEFPKLKTFATLSPIPGFRTWLAKNLELMLEKLSDKELSQLGRALSFEPPSSIHVLAALEQPETLAGLSVKSPLREFLTRCAAEYLGRAKEGDMVLDPVARFHLGNGARIERINFFADPSPKGIRQSHGLMVNYLYDLKRIDKHRKQLESGEAPASSQVEDLYFSN